jgi:formate dehydrogenase subunit gamma
VTLHLDDISTILARHAGRPGALLPILHDVQHALGYVPADAIPVIAEALNLSRAEVPGLSSSCAAPRRARRAASMRSRRCSSRTSGSRSKRSIAWGCARSGRRR